MWLWIYFCGFLGRDEPLFWFRVLLFFSISKSNLVFLGGVLSNYLLGSILLSFQALTRSTSQSIDNLLNTGRSHVSIAGWVKHRYARHLCIFFLIQISHWPWKLIAICETLIVTEGINAKFLSSAAAFNYSSTAWSVSEIYDSSFA